MPKSPFTVPAVVVFACLAVPALAQTRNAPSGSNAFSSSLSNTDWQGFVGSSSSPNVRATLRLFQQNGAIIGTLTYDGYEESVSVSTPVPGTVRLQGVSFRDLRGARSFYLDNFNGHLSTDGRRLQGDGRDARGAPSWFELQRADSTPPAPAPESLVRSLAGSNWEGSVSDAKGGEPAKLRILQQNGPLKGVLAYNGFEETVSIILTSSTGIEIQGTSARDLLREGRRFDPYLMRGQLSADGRSMRGSGPAVQFELRRTSR
jgi:hypothetical protein